MRRIPLILSSILLAVGLVIFFYDAYVIVRYGCDVNDVAEISDLVGPIDWPTGERPGYAMVPAFVYGIGFWLAAAVVLSLWPEGIRDYRGRIQRGAE